MHTTYVYTPTHMRETNVLTENHSGFILIPKMHRKLPNSPSSSTHSKPHRDRKSLKSGGEKTLANVLSKLLNPYAMSVVSPPLLQVPFTSDTPSLQVIRNPQSRRSRTQYPHPKPPHHQNPNRNRSHPQSAVPPSKVGPRTPPSLPRHPRVGEAPEQAGGG